jgi:hypothetical protein
MSATSRTSSSPLGRVVDFPTRRANAAASNNSSIFRRLTDEPAGHVDDWGRDAGMFRTVTMLSEVRWSVSTGGDQHLPARKGALIVVNARRFALAAVYSAFAISRAVDRPVRFVGRPDSGALGALAQRLGGLLDHPDEVAGALRAGELVVCSAAATTRPRDVGTIDHALIGAAIRANVDVFPAATTSSPFGRRARIEIGRATRQRQRRRGPLAEVELADHLSDDITLLLAEMGDINTGTPLDWLPLSGLGGN